MRVRVFGIPNPLLGGAQYVSEKVIAALGPTFEYKAKVKRTVRYGTKREDPTYNNFIQLTGAARPTAYAYANANNGAELPSVAKYGKAPQVFDEEALAFATMALQRYFLPIMGGARVKSRDEVLAEVDMNTSPGYPLNLKFTTKKDFLSHPGALQYLDEFSEQMAKPASARTWRPIWTSSVKGEIRSAKKVAANQLRTFCAGPIEMTVEMNKYCLEMNDLFYNAGAEGSCWSKVGMTKFSGRWDQLANTLKRHEKMFALDMKEYDASMGRRLQLIVCEFRQMCLHSVRDKLHLGRLYEEVIESLMVLTNGDVVQKSAGNPSGSSNTVVDNTLVLFLLFAYGAFLVARGAGIHLTYDYMLANFELALYGDDNTGSVSEDAAQWFDLRKFAMHMLDVNYVVTSEDDVWSWRTITDVKFLSQGFKLVNGRYVPVPDVEKLRASLLYGSGYADPRWSLYRANALYVEGFFTSFRAEIDMYRHWLLRFHRKELLSVEVMPKGLLPSSAFANWFTAKQAWQLYSGVAESRPLKLAQLQREAILKNQYDQNEEDAEEPACLGQRHVQVGNDHKTNTVNQPTRESQSYCAGRRRGSGQCDSDDSGDWEIDTSASCECGVVSFRRRRLMAGEGIRFRALRCEEKFPHGDAPGLAQ